MSECGTRSGLGTNDRDQRAVQDILDFCEQAARLVARRHDAFESDEMLRLAAEALAQRVGEAVSRLSKAYKISIRLCHGERCAGCATSSSMATDGLMIGWSGTH